MPTPYNTESAIADVAGRHSQRLAQFAPPSSAALEPPQQERTVVEPEWAKRELERRENERAAAALQLQRQNAPPPPPRFHLVTNGLRSVGPILRTAVQLGTVPCRAGLRTTRRHPWLAGCLVVGSAAIGFWLGGEAPSPSVPSRPELPALAEVIELPADGAGLAADEPRSVPRPVRTAAAFIDSGFQGQSADELRDQDIRTIPFLMYDGPLQPPAVSQAGYEAPRPADGQAVWLTGTIEEVEAAGAAPLQRVERFESAPARPER